jgi:hypothetical protein
MCQLQSPWPYSEGVEQRILLRGLVHADAVLSLDDWLCHWSLLAVNDPVAAQVRARFAGCGINSSWCAVRAVYPVFTACYA